MLLDVASYARRGPGRRDQLSPAEIELIARTVNRTPEVMVKVPAPVWVEGDVEVWSSGR